VTILAPGQRYEVANYKNVTIPTNLDVKEEARHRFGEFYAALFDRTLEKNPGAVVTEYAWDASSCDPCPTPALDPAELATLGADVLGAASTAKPAKAARPVAPGRKMPVPPPSPVPPPPMMSQSFVLTRLHAQDGISEDLVFKAAKAIAGGREWRGQDGKLEEGAIDYQMNNFQARYAIRHEWTGPIACADPIRGVWGGPPEGSQEVASGPTAATDLAFVPRGKTQLAQIVRQDVPEIGVVAEKSAEAQPPKPPQPPTETGTTFKPKKDKNGCAIGGDGPAWLVVLALGLLALRRRRTR
jgi:MYXO-CTERM domain-containing protein